jgi:HSP20 family protein
MTNELEAQKQEVEIQEGVERTRAARVYSPKVDIFSKDDGIVILAEMPGVDENDLDVTLEKNVLTIQGYVSPDEPEDYEMTYAEYGVGDYQRSFTLPDDIDRDNIDASISNGILRLFLQKAPEARARQITVKAA